MTDEQTVGERLGEYIGDGEGKAMSIRAFAKAMAQRNPRPSGSTRAMIHRYLGGAAPPSEFISAAAAILGINPAWLAFGVGQPTAAHAVAESTMTATAEPKFIGGLATNGPRASVARLRAIAPRLARFPGGLAAFVNVWDRYVRSSPTLPDSEQQYVLARRLWMQITAPLELLGIDAESAPDHYYITVLGALMSAVPAPGKGKDLSSKPRKEAKARTPMLGALERAATHAPSRTPKRSK